MTKSIKVVKNSLPKGVEMEKIIKYFERRSVASNAIDCVNWPEYPYKPRASFKIAHNGDEIFLQFRVVERGVRGTFEYDFGSEPWTDSCVEFFMTPDLSKPDYFNVEMTCIGHGTFACGPDREHRHNFDDSVISRIRRHASLGSSRVVREGGRQCWSLTLTIPFDIYGLDGKTVSGKKLRANFYKCGDKMSVPHFVSWNPIGCPNPDFHRPEYFGEVEFE